MTTKKKALSKYLYAAVLPSGLFIHVDGCVVSARSAVTLRAACAELGAKDVKIVRYVLESSIRPGGK